MGGEMLFLGPGEMLFDAESGAIVAPASRPSQLVPFPRPKPDPDRRPGRDFGRHRRRDPAEADYAAEETRLSWAILFFDNICDQK